MSGKLNLNECSETDLLVIKGIGPAKAKAIISLREQISSYSSVDQLLQIKGISKRLLDIISPFLYAKQCVLDTFPDDIKNVLPELANASSDKVVKKDIVRFGFNPGILDIGDAQKLYKLNWPATLRSWLLAHCDELSQTVITSSDVSNSILSHKSTIQESGVITGEQLDLFLVQLRARFSDAMEMSIHLYTWSDAGIHQILNNALNSNRATVSGKLLHGWKSIVLAMIQYIKRNEHKSIPEKVYRGCIATSTEIDYYVSTNRTFAWKGFISTSREFDVALAFAVNATARRRISPVVFEITVLPENVGAAEISGLSYYPSESEILFLPGSSFQVSEVTDHETFVEIKCTQVQSPLHNRNQECLNT